jgi:hypothetical protein
MSLIPVGSSILVGNSHYRAFVTNANAKCIELGQHVRHCCPKRYTSSSMLSSVRTCTRASILQSLFQSSVRTHEQGKVSVHSGLSSMLNDKKFVILDTPHSVLTSLVLSIVTPDSCGLDLTSFQGCSFSANLQGSEVHWEPV